LALILGACMTGNDRNDTASGTIDPKTMGQSLAANFSSLGNWQETIANPAAGLAIPSGGGPGAPTPSAMSKRSALAKSGARADDCPNPSVDTSTKDDGYVTYTCTVEDTTATAKVRWDAQAQDSIDGNENIISWSAQVTTAGGYNRVEFTDEDGDGLVNVTDESNKVRAVFTMVDGLTTEAGEAVVGPGPDLDFDVEDDNLTYAANWNRKLAGVLKASASFPDDDGDGIVVDNAAVSPVKVLLDEYEPSDRPLVYRVSVVARIEALGFGKGDEPVSLHITETLKTGRVNELYFRNSQGGEEFRANDTMHAFFETRVTASSDTLKSAKLEIVFNPGADLKTDADDLLYAVHIESHKRFGWERDAEFHFLPSEPVPHGQEAKAGSFSGKVTYANGKSATLEGSFTETLFTATFTGPEGNSVTVTYNKNGQVVGG
jgi:hypothetical protein